MPATIKICGLSTAAALCAALAAGADMVGFVFFERSPRFVALDRARELAAEARGRAKIVALGVDAADAALAAIVARIAPDLLQLHGSESPERVAEIRRAFAVPVMKALGVADAADFDKALEYQDAADWLLIDAKPPTGATRPGGHGVPFDWRLARGFAAKRPWLLSGGLEPGNVGEAIALSGARGVDVSSGVESAPGVKDIVKINAFVAAARAAFARRDEARSIA
ncbi:MAG: phosphoribosylanthranilate isomerase [Roseiarcus sp.]|jgi:phosphoribosylanthranilate isomerase